MVFIDIFIFHIMFIMRKITQTSLPPLGYSQLFNIAKILVKGIRNMDYSCIRMRRIYIYIYTMLIENPK